MSRYDDLRRMREAEFAAKAVTKPAKPDTVTKPVTKSVTKSDGVTKPSKRGRPTIGDKPMTPAERMRRYRAHKST